MPESLPNAARDPLNLIRAIPAEGTGTSNMRAAFLRDAVFLFMRLTINGEDRMVHASTVQGLLDELGIEFGRVAVEVNLQVVRRAEYGQFALKEGDAVEIVNFVGGG